jgi:RNA polymerase sigma factor (TIGR02999 family)
MDGFISHTSVLPKRGQPANCSLTLKVQFRGKLAQSVWANLARNPRCRARDGKCSLFKRLTSGDEAVILSSLGSCAVQQPTPEAVSELLGQYRNGNEESLRRLVPLVYNELRRVAHYHIRKERPDHTLQTTALVHEAYLCLTRQKPTYFQNRAHFFAVCSQLMRQILVQYARRRRAAKRDGGHRFTLDGAIALSKSRSVDLIALDDALKELARLDPQQSRIVELRFFGGLSIEDTSHVLGMSPATVKRHWSTARLWLRNQINKAERYDA